MMNQRIGALAALLMLALSAGCGNGPTDAPVPETEPASTESAEITGESAKALDKAGEELERNADPLPEEEEDASPSAPPRL